MKPKGKSMEKWKEVNKDMIPVGNYLLRLQCGDSEKFTVYLESDKYGIVLEFEEALSFHCVDEGQWLFLPYDDKPFDFFRGKNFDKVFYRIYDGKYHTFVKKYVGERFKDEEMFHYILVTWNFFFEIIALGTVNVTVKNLETEEIKEHVVDGTEG